MAPSGIDYQRLIDGAFPFPEYRTHQREILSKAVHGLFEDPDIDIVVIDAPTGIGKSPINVALSRLADSTFYTTPQKSLRRQLEEDDTLRKYYDVVRARDDYQCPTGTAELGEGGGTATCDTCHVNQDPEESCRQYNCTYWDAKVNAMQGRTAILTFSYLIADSTIEPFTRVVEDGLEKQIQVSFRNRELLIIDEAHSLEEQVASLHAGFTISPYTIPEPVYYLIKQLVEAIANAEKEHLIAGDVEDEVRTIHRDLRSRLREVQTDSSVRANDQEIEQLQKIVWRLGVVLDGLTDGSPWVIAASETQFNDEQVSTLKFQPVWVDAFLEQFVWSRADNIVLSTATMPFRGTPETWLRRLGLDPERAMVISRPMPFNVENRPIHTQSIVGPLTGGQEEKYWGRILDTLRLIAERHNGEKGLIHTVSYSRARRLYEHFESNSVLHERDERPAEAYLKEWQQASEDMLFTPSMMEGVDLPGEKCRWQVLVKVPYPYLGDARTNYLLTEEKEEQWYNSLASRKMIQSVGRGVRHETDTCDYYVLDESWRDVMDSVTIPAWFSRAIRE